MMECYLFVLYHLEKEKCAGIRSKVLVEQVLIHLHAVLEVKVQGSHEAAGAWHVDKDLVLFSEIPDVEGKILDGHRDLLDEAHVFEVSFVELRVEGLLGENLVKLYIELLIGRLSLCVEVGVRLIEDDVGGLDNDLVDVRALLQLDHEKLGNLVGPTI